MKTATPHTSNPTPTASHPSSFMSSNLAIFLIASYIAAQMLSNIASLKIGTVAGFAVDMGTFIYPLTFTLRDMLHKLLGKRATQSIILTSALTILFMAAYLMMSAAVTSDAGWAASLGPQMDLGAAFGAVLSPVWRVVIASVVAAVLSELLDTEVYHWFVSKITLEHQWARVLVSNAVSIPVDSAVFCLIAFWGNMPASVVWEIFVVNVLLKFGMTLFSIPLIYVNKVENPAQ